jgi:hypothetical protein
MTEDIQEEITLRPSAAKLLESMRDIGYSFQSALADIVDNSISAGATEISVINDVDHSAHPYVAIADNGAGMTADELTAAMQHGARGPRDTRKEGDLGRFGLGMKTASFSQCRRVTVVSRRHGMTSARCWDLNRVVECDEWVLQILSSMTISHLPGVEHLPETGTLVLWQNLDRLDSTGESADQIHEAMNRLFGEARKHLALTFHRFISPEPGDGISAVCLRINGMPLEALDPFARHMTPRSDAHEVEVLAVPEGKVIAQAFTLPHHQRLTSAQSESLALGSSLNETQGLYIYRAKRLIAGGTWLGLAKRSELTKLLRVRVDVPTTLDSEWGVDVRKSRIRPPAAIRARLKPLVERMTDSAKRPYTYRGTRQSSGGGLPFWLRITERGQIRYEINRDHPVIVCLRNGLNGSGPDLDILLSGVEATLPLEAMFSDVGSDPHSVRQSQMEMAQLESLLAAFVEAVAPNSDVLSGASANSILQTYPFAGDDRAAKILARLRCINSDSRETK